MTKDKSDVTSNSHAAETGAGEDHLDAQGLAPMVQDEIGRRLRAVYGQLAEEPLPDKFRKLLQELANSDNKEQPK